MKLNPSFKRFLQDGAIAAITVISLISVSSQASAGCTAQKVYSELKEYLGCKVTYDDGRDVFHKPTRLTEIGCDKYCQASLGAGSFGFDGFFSRSSKDLAGLGFDSLSDFQIGGEESSSLPSLVNYDDGIAEAFQTEVVFSHASDSKPIIASYGAGPCIIFAGYSSEHKIGFLTHISTPREILPGALGRGSVIAGHLAKLLSGKKGKFDLYLTGGQMGQSEETLKAIKQWIKNYNSMFGEMEMVHEDTLGSGFGGKSLALDTRDGSISKYSPLKNKQHRDLDDVSAMEMAMSGFIPKMTVAYFPKTTDL